MDTKTYTLIMKTYEYDLIKGTVKQNIKTVKDCVLYKDAESLDDVWLATTQQNPEVFPIMITDDGKKIYFLKNWTTSQNNYSISNDILRITTFTNDYMDIPQEFQKKYINDILDKISENLSKFKEMNK